MNTDRNHWYSSYHKQSSNRALDYEQGRFTRLRSGPCDRPWMMTLQPWRLLNYWLDWLHEVILVGDEPKNADLAKAKSRLFGEVIRAKEPVGGSESVFQPPPKLRGELRSNQRSEAPLQLRKKNCNKVSRTALIARGGVKRLQGVRLSFTVLIFC